MKNIVSAANILGWITIDQDVELKRANYVILNQHLICSDPKMWIAYTPAKRKYEWYSLNITKPSSDDGAKNPSSKHHQKLWLYFLTSHNILDTTYLSISRSYRH
jgi:hypothetical protein